MRIKDILAKNLKKKKTTKNNRLSINQKPNHFFPIIDHFDDVGWIRTDISFLLLR